jgi:hypothetical protein
MIKVEAYKSSSGQLYLSAQEAAKSDLKQLFSDTIA